MKTNRYKAIVSAVAFLAVSGGSAGAYERWVDIRNRSDELITEIYISNVHESWEDAEEVLGSRVIWPGDEMRVEPYHPNGYCRFDVMIIYENGEEDYFYDVNLCEITDLTV